MSKKVNDLAHCKCQYWKRSWNAWEWWEVDVSLCIQSSQPSGMCVKILIRQRTWTNDISRIRHSNSAYCIAPANLCVIWMLWMPNAWCVNFLSFSSALLFALYLANPIRNVMEVLQNAHSEKCVLVFDFTAFVLVEIDWRNSYSPIRACTQINRVAFK